MESAPFFIPSTSLCSPSSWLTSSCAYHLITVTTFDFTIYHSFGLSLYRFKSKTHLFHKSFPPKSFWFHLDCLHRSWICTGLSSGNWRLFVLDYLFNVLFLATCARLSWTQYTLSFPVHAKLFCLIYICIAHPLMSLMRFCHIASYCIDELPYLFCIVSHRKSFTHGRQSLTNVLIHL